MLQYEKMMLASPLVFLFSFILFRYFLMEIWTIEDRFWEPDGTNMKQGKFDVLGVFDLIVAASCIHNFGAMSARREPVYAMFLSKSG
ncbi:MAG: hypothetical protein ACJAWC_002702 [Yoonia sp.]|jgi:hypothetical protein